MSFRLYIDTDTFADGERDPETARLLREVADRLESPGVHDFNYYQTIHDANGNDVGRFTFKPGRMFE